MQQSDIDNRFAFHPATTEEKRNEHTSVREHCRELATFINENVPEGREKALAITHLEEVMLWANAAIARSSAEDKALSEQQRFVELEGRIHDALDTAWFNGKVDVEDGQPSMLHLASIAARAVVGQ